MELLLLLLLRRPLSASQTFLGNAPLKKQKLSRSLLAILSPSLPHLLLLKNNMSLSAHFAASVSSAAKASSAAAPRAAPSAAATASSSSSRSPPPSIPPPSPPTPTPPTPRGVGAASARTSIASNGESLVLS